MLHCYIIVPYRARGNQTERRQQLEYFIPYMNNYMKQLNLKFTIMVMEQNDNKPFNRGKLFNIGMLEAAKLFVEGEKPYFCHQNVDLIPQKIDYSLYSEGITDIWGYYLGLGAMYFTDLPSYTAINGYPNDYEGWGADDVILLERCKFKNIPVDLSFKNVIWNSTEELYKRNNKTGALKPNDPVVKELYLLDCGVYNRDKWVNCDTNKKNNEKVKKELENPESYIENGLNTCTYQVDYSIYKSTHKHYFLSWD